MKVRSYLTSELILSVAYTGSEYKHSSFDAQGLPENTMDNQS